MKERKEGKMRRFSVIPLEHYNMVTHNVPHTQYLNTTTTWGLGWQDAPKFNGSERLHTENQCATYWNEQLYKEVKFRI